MYDDLQKYLASKYAAIVFILYISTIFCKKKNKAISSKSSIKDIFISRD